MLPRPGVDGKDRSSGRRAGTVADSPRPVILRRPAMLLAALRPLALTLSLTWLVPAWAAPEVVMARGHDVRGPALLRGTRNFLWYDDGNVRTCRMAFGRAPAASYVCASAPLGELDFVVQGAMIGGFALVAAPADYEVTGVKTFIVCHDGVVYEKDLGPKTLEAFKAMERFDPDGSWSPVEEP